MEVEKGMKNGQKVTFHGEGDHDPDADPGDVIFVLTQKEHDKFHRKGDDLLMEKSITLKDALCGCQVTIKHLDDRNIVVKSEPGEVIKPGDIRVVHDEGMPQHRNPFVKGKLFIRFNVNFPVAGDVNPSGLEMLRRVLPGVQETEMPMDAEECNMEPGDLKMLGYDSRGRSTDATGEDDDDHPRQGGVQCAQQ